MRKLLLQAEDEHRAALAGKGLKWQDELGKAQDTIKTAWPADVAKMLTEAKISAQLSETWRKSFLALTPEKLNKLLTEQKEKVQFDDSVRALLAKEKRAVSWPEPLQLQALEMMQYHAHLLHAQLKGRTIELPKENPLK